MCIEQQIEELRRELGACEDRAERVQIEHELKSAQAELARFDEAV